MWRVSARGRKYTLRTTLSFYMRGLHDKNNK